MKLAKTEIQQFILKQLKLFKLKELDVEFTVRGLDFDPNMFIRAGEMGLEIGFHRLVWNCPVAPDMTRFTHHILLWEHLEELSDSEKAVEMKESINIVADFRKRRYQQCEFVIQGLCLNIFLKMVYVRGVLVYILGKFLILFNYLNLSDKELTLFRKQF